MDKARFKEELRGRIHDFSTSCGLTNLSNAKNPTQKEKEIEERYKELESWIIGGVEKLRHPMVTVSANSLDEEPGGTNHLIDLGF